MKHHEAKKLREAANKTADLLSDPNREGNTMRETFIVHDIQSLSENTAAVIYNKSGGKKYVVFFYLSKGKWWYIPADDSHLIGMAAFPAIKLQIEKMNFWENFNIDEILPEDSTDALKEEE